MKKNIGEFFLAVGVFVSVIMFLIAIFDVLPTHSVIEELRDNIMLMFFLFLFKLSVLLKVRERNQTFALLGILIGVFNIILGDNIGGGTFIIGGLISWYDIYDVGF